MELSPLAYDSPKSLVGECRNPSMKERLEGQKQDLEARLVRINAALAALNEHPEVMKVLELVSKV